MLNQKYYDLKRQVYLRIPEDVCNYSDWENNTKSYACAIHPDEFLIFVPWKLLESRDEYKNGDPFGIEDKMDSPFHKGRTDTTIEILNQSLGNLNEKHKLLDVGCGQGHISSRVKSMFPAFDVTGLDISLNAIRFAHQHYKEIDFVVGDAYNPPFPDSYFDIIICNNTYEHVPDPVKMLMSLNRVLKSGGLFVMSTPSRYRTANLLKAALGRKVTINKHHVTEYSVGQVKEQFRFAGFSIIDVHGLYVKGQGGSFISMFVVHKILRSFFHIFFALIGSHHVLDSTAFFVARKN